MHSLLCSLKAGIREQLLIACPRCRPCRSVNCVWLNCLRLLLYMAALSNGWFFSPWYSSTLFSGKSWAILECLSYCLKDIVCTFPSRLALGIHLTGMRWSASFVMAPWISTPWRLERGLTAAARAQPRTRCENTKSNSQFPCVCQPPSQDPSHLPLPSHQYMAQTLLAFQGYKSSTGADSLRWSSLVGCV